MSAIRPWLHILSADELEVYKTTSLPGREGGFPTPSGPPHRPEASSAKGPMFLCDDTVEEVEAIHSCQTSWVRDEVWGEVPRRPIRVEWP